MTDSQFSANMSEVNFFVLNSVQGIKIKGTDGVGFQSNNTMKYLSLNVFYQKPLLFTARASNSISSQQCRRKTSLFKFKFNLKLHTLEKISKNSCQTQEDCIREKCEPLILRRRAVFRVQAARRISFIANVSLNFHIYNSLPI